MCTIPDIGAKFQVLKDTIRHHILPAISGIQALSNVEEELMALPVRLSSLGIPIHTRSAPSQFRSLLIISDPLVSLIIEQSPHYILNTPGAPKRQLRLQWKLTIGLQHRNRPRHGGHNCLNHINSLHPVTIQRRKGGKYADKKSTHAEAILFILPCPTCACPLLPGLITLQLVLNTSHWL